MKVKTREWLELTMTERMLQLIDVHEQQGEKRKALSMALEKAT